ILEVSSTEKNSGVTRLGSDPVPEPNHSDPTRVLRAERASRWEFVLQRIRRRIRPRSPGGQTPPTGPPRTAVIFAESTPHNHDRIFWLRLGRAGSSGEISKSAPRNSILEQEHIEINQQAPRDPRELHVREQLSLVDGQNLVDRLELHDHQVGDEDIGKQVAI